MDKPLVSIIVPVYNSEVYLGTCLESLRGQTWPNLEIILVNDGSTDGSGRLCVAAARVDHRIRFLDRPNGGVSAARNSALAVARGDYLQFSDSDDRLTPDATETLVRAAQSTGADLVISHFFRVDGEKQAQRGHIKGERLLTRQEFAQEMVKAPANYYYGALWNKLYRRSIVEKQGLRFAEDVNWSEDFLFNLEYIRHVRLVAAVPKPLYYYHKRPGSLITSQATLRRVIRMKRDTFDYYKNLYQDLDLYDEQKARVYRYLISTATDGSTLTLPVLGEKSRRVRESTD
ncbi:glycosyltransferase family 2 protein [Intestinimonas sp. HCP28S3_D6]|uniref:glycosyltransferase family 2 protein n=1 Tax=Intestinimonas sp. HCP28S3_D6 TaxID=3438942 RepID=UPI003F88B632